MENNRYQIIFEMLTPKTPDDSKSRQEVLEVEALISQSDEIAGLREMVADLSEPEPRVYTTT